MAAGIVLPTMGASAATQPISKMAPPTVSMAANGDLTATWTAPRTAGSIPVQGYDVTVIDQTNGSGLYDVVTDGSTFTATIPHEYLQNFGAVRNIAGAGRPAMLQGSYVLQVAAYQSDMMVWSPQSNNSKKIVESQKLVATPVTITLPNASKTAQAGQAAITVRNNGNVNETVMGTVGNFTTTGVSATLTGNSAATLAPGQTATIGGVQVNASSVKSGKYIAHLPIVDAGTFLPEPPGTQAYSSDMAVPGTVMATMPVTVTIAK